MARIVKSREEGALEPGRQKGRGGKKIEGGREGGRL